MIRTVKSFRYFAVDDKTAVRISTILLAIPFLFLIENTFEYILHADFALLAYFTEIFKTLDRKIVFIGPLLFIVGPIVAAFLNVFSVITLGYDKKQRIVDIKIHLKWMNLFFLFICIMSLSASAIYMILAKNGF